VAEVGFSGIDGIPQQTDEQWTGLMLLMTIQIKVYQALPASQVSG
jgi:hypothetical protein